MKLQGSASALAILAGALAPHARAAPPSLHLPRPHQQFAAGAAIERLQNMPRSTTSLRAGPFAGGMHERVRNLHETLPAKVGPKVQRLENGCSFLGTDS